MAGITRRRGIPRKNRSLVPISILMLVGLSTIIFISDLILGAHIFGNLDSNTAPEASPLAAANQLAHGLRGAVKKQKADRAVVAARPAEKEEVDAKEQGDVAANNPAEKEQTVGNGRDPKRADPKYYPYMTLPISADYDFSKYEPLGGGRFAEYKDGDSPYAITDKLKEQSDELARSRRVHVLNAMKHVWKNYKEKAFGSDELHPISGSTTQNWGGMGTTLVDALDTLWLMGLKDEFWEARDWVRDHLSNTPSGDVSGFETTIRSLGGLLSAYDLSGDKAFLEKAEDLGKRLQKAYDTKSGLPRGQVNLASGASYGNQFVLAEIGTRKWLFYLFNESNPLFREVVFSLLGEIMVLRADRVPISLSCYWQQRIC